PPGLLGSWVLASALWAGLSLWARLFEAVLSEVRSRFARCRRLCSSYVCRDLGRYCVVCAVCFIWPWFVRVVLCLDFAVLYVGHTQMSRSLYGVLRVMP